MVNQNYNDLIKKIDEFIRKFYLNKILRGCIYVSATLLATYLFIFLSFYFFNPGIEIKTVIFFTYLFTAIFLIVFFVVKPLLAYLKLSNHLSFEEASVIIGNHFSTIKDKLLNTLQLHKISENNNQNNALIIASIDQKIIELKPIPFYTAVKLNENKKFLKYLFFPLAIILLIALIAPSILKIGTQSFFKYNEYIAPQAPFKFNLTNPKLVFIQGDDVLLKLNLNGDQLPQEVYVVDGKNTYKLEKEKINQFNYRIKNIQTDKKIIFKAGGFNSETFNIIVKSRPELLNASAQLIFPAYLNKKSESLTNVGDLLLPEGTKVIWEFTTYKTSQILFKLNNKLYDLAVNDNKSKLSAIIKNNLTYSIVTKNEFVTLSDSLAHQITVIKDQLPNIVVVEKADSVNNKQLYFTGEASDDYGLSKISFKYQVKENEKTVNSQTKNIAIKPNSLNQPFLYLFDLKELVLKENQKLEYYFEATDNDGFNGPKTVRSEIKTYKPQTKKETADQININNLALKQKMQSAIKLASSIEKESRKIAESLLDKKQLSFEDQKQIEQLLDKQKQLDEAVKEIKNLNEKNNLEKENQSLNQELLDKQKQIKDLFDHVLDDKTKELLQKLQNLMNERNKDQTKEEISKMQMDSKTVKNELDRILELYKQLEFEQNLQNSIDRLDDLSKKQKELAEQTKNKKQDNKLLKEKQEGLNQELKDLKNEIKKLEEKNQALERPNAMDKNEKDLQDIQKDQEDSKDALDKNDSKKAVEKQQKASEKMSQLSKKMNEMQQQGSDMENNLNAKELRRLLENILTTSFEQEKIMLGLKRIASTDPTYTLNVQKQRVLKDNLKIIADSLYALSKRVPQIESTVNEEMNKITFNLDKSLESLAERRTAEANRYQQFTMTSINNLSLMLSEALNQLQNASKSAKNGKGKKKQGMKELSQMQEQLNKNMEQAKQQMQKSGNQGTVGKGEMSKEFGKMAQQQQMIRQALEKINREENKDGTGKLGNLNQAIQEMKQTEGDLVNKRLQQETLQRQKDLLTKLLDAEKAERDQKEDDKRQSKAAQEFPPAYIKMLNQFKKEHSNGSDIFQKLPPTLNYYYKNKIIEYLKALDAKQ